MGKRKIDTSQYLMLEIKKECNDNLSSNLNLNDFIYSIHYSITGDSNRGWQDDLFVLKLRNNVTNVYESIAYLHVAYIPKNLFEKHYSLGVFDYLGKISGRTALNLKYYTKKEILSNTPLSRFWNKNNELENLSKKEIEHSFDSFLKSLDISYGKKYNEFVEFHVEKPLVNFIYVNENYQRNGFYQRLYEIAAKEYSKSKLKLYTSNIKSKESLGAWKKLKNNILISENNFDIFSEGKREGLIYKK